MFARDHQRRVAAWIVLAALATASGCGEETAPQPPAFPLPTPLDVSVPGFPRQRVPADNPTTVEGVALGRRLFYDPILSGDSTQSCASCHSQAFAFSDHGLRTSVGIDGLDGTRNATALVNPGWSLSHFWDGRAADLEAQALEPVPNPIEMHESWDRATAKLRRSHSYPDLFGAAFGSRDITSDRVVKAIAQFERTMVSANSRYDRWNRHEIELDDNERRGYVLFFDPSPLRAAECFHCHPEPLFTDHSFQNNGLDSLFVDRGRGMVTNDPHDDGKFKTPTLRNLAFTSPYMHDGRFTTLEQVLDHYDSGGHGTTNVNPFILNLRRNHALGNGLTADEKRDLLAFLLALTDSTYLTDPDLASPFP